MGISAPGLGCYDECTITGTDYTLRNGSSPGGRRLLKMFNRLALGLRAWVTRKTSSMKPLWEVAGLDGLISAFQEYGFRRTSLARTPAMTRLGLRLLGAACPARNPAVKFRKKWPISATRPTWPC